MSGLSTTQMRHAGSDQSELYSTYIMYSMYSTYSTMVCTVCEHKPAVSFSVHSPVACGLPWCTAALYVPTLPHLPLQNLMSSMLLYEASLLHQVCPCPPAGTLCSANCSGSPSQYHAALCPSHSGSPTAVTNNLDDSASAVSSGTW